MMANVIPPSISDEAVALKTGKTWPEWFEIIDQAGGMSMNHKQIVAILTEAHAASDWWVQMITVAYEQARGLRDKHETPEGYQVGKSKTINATPQDAFNLLAETDFLAARLPGFTLTITTATPAKSIRIALSDGGRVDVQFYPKGSGRTQVTVNHNKIQDASQIQPMKDRWDSILSDLKEKLEG